MRTYSVARARQHLAEVLDSAERGENVTIERRGVRFTIQPVRASASRTTRRRASRVELVDPTIEAGNWSWARSESGQATLTTPRRRKGS